MLWLRDFMRFGGKTFCSLMNRGPRQYRISVQNSSLTQISCNLIRPSHPFQLSNHFVILLRARQYHCRALCKISKRLDKWQISYGQTRFHEIWVEDEFQTDILYCTAPQNMHWLWLGYDNDWLFCGVLNVLIISQPRVATFSKWYFFNIFNFHWGLVHRKYKDYVYGRC